MSQLQNDFDDYSQEHRTPGNKICHQIGIPLITVTLLGLLSRVGIEGFDLGMLLLSLAIGWYLKLEWRLGLPFAFVAIGAYFLGKGLSLPVQWAGFVLGWVFQFIGHGIYEKKRPAFVRNLRHVLIGPLWIFEGWIGFQGKQ